MPAKGGPRKRPMTVSHQSGRKWLKPKSLRVNRTWNRALTPRSDRLKANSLWTVWSGRPSAALQILESGPSRLPSFDYYGKGGLRPPASVGAMFSRAAVDAGRMQMDSAKGGATKDSLRPSAARRKQSNSRCSRTWESIGNDGGLPKKTDKGLRPPALC